MKFKVNGNSSMCCASIKLFAFSESDGLITSTYSTIPLIAIQANCLKWSI